MKKWWYCLLIILFFPIARCDFGLTDEEWQRESAPMTVNMPIRGSTDGGSGENQQRDTRNTTTVPSHVNKTNFVKGGDPRPFTPPF